MSNVPQRRVLLVEDNEGVGKFAAGLLKELGQAVTWVGDGQAALKALNNDPEGFDLVFTDVVMVVESRQSNRPPGLVMRIARRLAWPGRIAVVRSQTIGSSDMKRASATSVALA